MRRLLSNRRSTQGYAFAINWMVTEDDTSWTEDEYGVPSITASIVGDLWDKSIVEVTEDIKKLKKVLSL